MMLGAAGTRERLDGAEVACVADRAYSGCGGETKGEAIMRRIFGALSAAVLLGAGSAHGYSNIFAFGDSLSDGGNAFALTSGANAPPPPHWPPSPPYAERFSNGPTAVEQLARSFGLPAILPAVTPGGTNYAVGGATTNTLNYNYQIGFPPGLPATLATTGMQAQVGQFLGGMPTNVGDSLFFLWGGPNDIFLGFQTGGPAGAAQAAANAVGNLAGLVRGLAGGGARQFLVLNMPDLGSTPGGQASANPAGLTKLSQDFNVGLEDAMNQVEQGLDNLGLNVDITVFDTFALLADVTKNPANYGLSNVTSPCLANLAAGCAGFLYFDENHPTVLGHAILATELYTTLIPEPESWAMLVAGLLVLGFAVRRRRLG
jgi:phospholipase/lecithinase/hemolysin